jgi:hypothetical protein
MKTLLRLEPFRLKNDGYAIMDPKNPVRFNSILFRRVDTG